MQHEGSAAESRQIRAADVAQTNLRLFAQLGGLGYSSQDIVYVRTAYDLATELFTNAFRGSGKPFVCHLVGTASAAACETSDREVIAVGLLHAAHALGRWPSRLGKTRPAQRKHVAGLLGERAAALLDGYTAFSWTGKAIGELAAGPAQPEQATLVLLRLANEVDDWIDHAAFAADGKVKLREAGRKDDILRVAEIYGFRNLAHLLRQVFEPPADAAWLPGIATGKGNTLRIEERLGDVLRRGFRHSFGGKKKR